MVEEMREIKFRAWNPKEANPHMFYFDLELIRNDENEANWQNMECVMQYTGLKDQNGKEIYEGDVVGYNRDRGQVIRHEITAKREVYGHGHSGESAFSGFKIDGYYGYPSDVEIIGNIYENPELCE